MYKIVLCVLLLAGCAYWGSSNKTPLTPQGQLNVCIRDEINSYRDKGIYFNASSWSVAQKIAGYCTDKYGLYTMYNQAVTNARNMMGANEYGTSLKRW